MLLTRAFRSLSRPSSPRSSKASTIHLYSLDHIIVCSAAALRPLYGHSTHQRNFLSFHQLPSLIMTQPMFFLPLCLSKNIAASRRFSPQSYLKNYFRNSSVCAVSLARFCGFLKPETLRHQYRLKHIGLIRVELMTPSLSEKCSNRLSYRPGFLFGVIPENTKPFGSMFFKIKTAV